MKLSHYIITLGSLAFVLGQSSAANAQLWEGILGLIDPETSGGHTGKNKPQPISKEHWPEMVPHMGLWKQYGPNASPVAKNSVDAFHRAVDHNVKSVEIDVNVATVSGQDHIFAFHGDVWNPGTNFTHQLIGPASDDYHWGFKKFHGHDLTTYSLKVLGPEAPENVVYRQLTWDDINEISLRAVSDQHNGRTWVPTRDRAGTGGHGTRYGTALLTLNQFLLQTICQQSEHALATEVILDVKTVEAAELAGEVIKDGVCPNGDILYRDRVVLKIFAGKTIPEDFAQLYTPSQLPEEMISYYGANVRYIFQFNDGVFDPQCTQSPCEVVASDGTIIELKGYRDAIFNHSQVVGLSVSWPRRWPHKRQEKETFWNAVEHTIYDELAWPYFKMKESGALPGRVLMSVGQRPDDYIKADIPGQTHNLHGCMMYAYSGVPEGVIKLYGDTTYARRLEFAIKPNKISKQGDFNQGKKFFDKVVIDGYSLDFKAEYDAVKEIEQMCGYDIDIFTELASHDLGYGVMFNLTNKSYFTHHRKLKGEHAIREHFRY